MRSFLPAAALLSLALMLCGCVKEQKQSNLTGCIYGYAMTVADGVQVPVSGATVRCWVGTSEKRGTVTNADGSYLLTGIEAGQNAIFLSITHPWFSNAQRGGLHISPGDSLRYDFLLSNLNSITFDPEELRFAGNKSVDTVTVRASNAWSIGYCPEWISADRNNGISGAWNVELTSEKNTSGDWRRDSVVFCSEGHNHVLQIEQAPCYAITSIDTRMRSSTASGQFTDTVRINFNRPLPSEGEARWRFEQVSKVHYYDYTDYTIEGNRVTLMIKNRFVGNDLPFRFSFKERRNDGITLFSTDTISNDWIARRQVGCPIRGIMLWNGQKEVLAICNDGSKCIRYSLPDLNEIKTYNFPFNGWVYNKYDGYVYGWKGHEVFRYDMETGSCEKVIEFVPENSWDYYPHISPVKLYFSSCGTAFVALKNEQTSGITYRILDLRGPEPQVIVPVYPQGTGQGEMDKFEVRHCSVSPDGKSFLLSITPGILHRLDAETLEYTGAYQLDGILGETHRIVNNHNVNKVIVCSIYQQVILDLDTGEVSPAAHFDLRSEGGVDFSYCPGKEMFIEYYALIDWINMPSFYYLQDMEKGELVFTHRCGAGHDGFCNTKDGKYSVCFDTGDSGVIGLIPADKHNMFRVPQF